MLKTDKEKEICLKYSTRDDAGNVHCSECPMAYGKNNPYDFRCKANSHWDRKEKDYIYDKH